MTRTEWLLKKIQTTKEDILYALDLASQEKKTSENWWEYMEIAVDSKKKLKNLEAMANR